MSVEKLGAKPYPPWIIIVDKERGLEGIDPIYGNFLHTSAGFVNAPALPGESRKPASTPITHAPLDIIDVAHEMKGSDIVQGICYPQYPVDNLPPVERHVLQNPSRKGEPI